MRIKLLSILLLTLTSCFNHGETTMENKRVGVMTFNVENLFDTTHAVGKTDRTFLPKEMKSSKEHLAYCATIKYKKWKDQCLDLDWSKETLQKKMKALSKSILQVNHGYGPDILILQEVENLQVLKQLKDKYLQKAKYSDPILLEGKDLRGIDVAIMTRLKQKGEAKLHQVPFKGLTQKELDDTRGILQADFELDGGETLTVFANHFPAPFHPKEYRIQAFAHLAKLLDELPKNRLALAAGDFNVPSEEDRAFHILRDHVSSHWMPMHLQGCKGCKGTAYYPPKKSWSFLDMILLSNSFQNQTNWVIDRSTIILANQAEDQIDENGWPKSFNPITGKGVSDHWPIYLEIFFQEKKGRP